MPLVGASDYILSQCFGVDQISNTRLRHRPFFGAPEREIIPVRTLVMSCQSPTFADLLTRAGSKTQRLGHQGKALLGLSFSLASSLDN